MQSVKSFLIISCLFYLASCSGNSINTNPTTFVKKTPHPMVMSSITSNPPTLSVLPVTPMPSTPTSIPVYPTNTLTPSVTTTIPPEARLKVHCLDISETLPSSINIKGSVILFKNEKPQALYFQNMKTREQQTISATNNQAFFYPMVSPGGKWLAFQKYTTGDKYASVLIANSDGQIKKIVSPNPDWANLSRWLTDETLVIRHSLKPISTLTILNPFSGSQKILFPDFPDLQNYELLPDWQNQTETVYDPTLTRVVYPRNTYLGEIVLEDLQRHKIIALVSPITSYESNPRWSPDGDQFIYTNLTNFNASDNNELSKRELFSMTRDGEIKQLTNLSSYYHFTDILDYAWSPDEHYIAYWLAKRQDDPSITRGIPQLVILNLETGLVTNYCIESYYPLIPIWSPDSRQLILQTTQEDGSDSIILVDVENDIAAKIASGLIPVGWMTTR